MSRFECRDDAFGQAEQVKTVKGRVVIHGGVFGAFDVVEVGVFRAYARVV